MAAATITATMAAMATMPATTMVVTATATTAATAATVAAVGGAPTVIGSALDNDLKSRPVRFRRTGVLSFTSALELRDQRIGNLEIGGDVLHIVVFLERADQFQNLLARLVLYHHGILRPPDERGLARLAKVGLQRLLRLAQRLDRSDHLVLLRPGDDVIGAGVDRRLEHRVVGGDLSIEYDQADAIEHERDGAGFRQRAARLAEIGAHFAGGAVAIVGQRLDDNGDPARRITLVANFVVILAVGARGLLDGALDIVLGHVFCAGGEDGRAKARIHRHVRQAHLRRDGYFARQFREEL